MEDMLSMKKEFEKLQGELAPLVSHGGVSRLLE
jgi:hypothetical protein